MFIRKQVLNTSPCSPTGKKKKGLKKPENVIFGKTKSINENVYFLNMQKYGT